MVARGGHRYVLGLQSFEGGKDISTEITVWDGVVVSPLAPAYQDTPEPMDTDDKGRCYYFAQIYFIWWISTEIRVCVPGHVTAVDKGRSCY